MDRRSPPQKRTDDHAFPVRVKVLVPERGFENLLLDMHRWPTPRLRPHAAESRIRELALETPVQLIVFDLLVRSGTSLLGLPLTERRRELEDFMARVISSSRRPRFRAR